MFCSKCGKEINTNAMICVHCGCLLDGYTLEQLNNPTVQSPVGQVPVEKKKSNVCAIVGFVLSLVGFFLGYYLYVVLIAGLVLSIVGLVQSKKLENGNGLAIAGLIISAVGLAIWLIVIIIVFAEVIASLFAFFFFLLFI